MSQSESRGPCSHGFLPLNALPKGNMVTRQTCDLELKHVTTNRTSPSMFNFFLSSKVSELEHKTFSEVKTHTAKCFVDKRDCFFQVKMQNLKILLLNRELMSSNYWPAVCFKGIGTISQCPSFCCVIELSSSSEESCDPRVISDCNHSRLIRHLKGNSLESLPHEQGLPVI